MPRKYTGNTDGVAPGVRPGTTELIRLASKRFAVTNLGTYVNRPMRGSNQLSVHATGRAVDLGYQNRNNALLLWGFLIANTRQLGIEAIHDYAFDPDGNGPQGAFGRGYRCSRGEGDRGVKIFTATDNAGTPGARWLHVELSPAMADNPTALRAAWIDALKRAGIK